MKRGRSTEDPEGTRATRREFVKASVAGAVGLTVGMQAAGSEAQAPKTEPAAPYNERTFAAMPTRNLGADRLPGGDLQPSPTFAD